MTFLIPTSSQVANGGVIFKIVKAFKLKAPIVSDTTSIPQNSKECRYREPWHGTSLCHQSLLHHCRILEPRLHEDPSHFSVCHHLLTNFYRWLFMRLPCSYCQLHHRCDVQLTSSVSLLNQAQHLSNQFGFCAIMKSPKWGTSLFLPNTRWRSMHSPIPGVVIDLS